MVVYEQDIPIISQWAGLLLPGQLPQGPLCAVLLRCERWCGVVTERQERFCIEFVRCGNATEAYKAAGYKPSKDNAAAVNASKMLRNANILAKIAKLRDEMNNAKILDAQQRRILLSEIANAKGQDAVRALDVLNKMDGIYITKQQISGADGGPLRFRWENDNG